MQHEKSGGNRGIHRRGWRNPETLFDASKEETDIVLLGEDRNIEINQMPLIM